MNMAGAQAIGLIFLAIVFYGVGLLMLRRQPRQIRLFAVALLTVGLGYLATTPAPTAIARILFGAPY
jgi:hypothetical protein